MRGSRVALAAVLLAALLVGTLLVFTAAGQQVGEYWSEPAEVAALQSDQDTLITDVAADGGPDGGAVAWIERDGDNRTVRVARFTVRNGTVEVGRRQTVARRAERPAGVDVAVRGDDLVVVWSSPVSNRVVLAHPTDGGVDRRVVADPFRVGAPTVALTSGGPVVAYSATDDAAAPFEVRTAHVAGGNVTVARVGGPSSRAHRPTVASAGDRLAVVWYDVVDDTAMVSTGRAGSTATFDRTVVAGDARVRGAFGGSTREVPFMAGARTRSTVRPVWTDVGTVSTTGVAENGAVGDPREFGPGGHPDVAVRGDRWLLAWVVPREGTGDDAFFHTSEDAGGVLSQFTSDAIRPRPVFAPDPGAAWVEWGDADRVLVSAQREARQESFARRLTNDPQRFAFLSLVAIAMGLVTVPVMPWSFLALFGAFVATTGVVTSRVLRAGAWLSTRLGRETSAYDLRNRLGDAHPALWMGLFAIVETPLVVYMVDAGLHQHGFANGVGVSAGALLAALAFVVVGRVESNWRAVIAFVCFQNMAMWVVAATEFL